MTKEEFVERMRYVLAGNDNPDSVKASAEAAVAICEGMGLKFDAPPSKTPGELIAETFVVEEYPATIRLTVGNGYGDYRFGIGEGAKVEKMLRQYVGIIVDRAIADEREACAKVAESLLTNYDQWLYAKGKTDTKACYGGIVHQAIRARGDK